MMTYNRRSGAEKAKPRGIGLVLDEAGPRDFKIHQSFI